MKIIEALKQIKELTVKADDLRQRIAKHTAYLSIETPVYPDQKSVVSGWLQAHEDIVQEIGLLNYRVAKTNNATRVAVTFGDTVVTKSITEWVFRRRVAAAIDLQAWQQLGDRGLREGNVPSSAGGTPTEVKIVRCYDPVLRDKKIEMYKSEPSVIDRTLEVVNATTDLLPA